MFKRKTQTNHGVTCQCLFKKHGVSSGKITIEYITYRESSKEIMVKFLIVADGMQHTFVTIVDWPTSDVVLVDNAFDKISRELDDWLGVNKEFNSLKNKLDGKVIFEYNGDAS